jgi:hypothetical protein
MKRLLFSVLILSICSKKDEVSPLTEGEINVRGNIKFLLRIKNKV